jgi:hypothetical protein
MRNQTEGQAMNKDLAERPSTASFSGRPRPLSRLIGVAAAILVTGCLFQTVATTFTSSAQVQIAKAKGAKVTVASAR